MPERDSVQHTESRQHLGPGEPDTYQPKNHHRRVQQLLALLAQGN